MNAPIRNISVELNAARQKLKRLREKRGAATLDGTSFDDSLIAAAEAEVASLEEAAEEVVRRDNQRLNDASTEHKRQLFAAYETAFEARLAALDRAEPHARALGVELAAAMKAAEQANAAALELGGDADAAFVSTNHGERLLALVKGALRAAIGKRHLGSLDMSPRAEDPGPSAKWIDSEKTAGDQRGYLRRRHGSILA